MCLLHTPNLSLSLPHTITHNLRQQLKRDLSSFRGHLFLSPGFYDACSIKSSKASFSVNFYIPHWFKSKDPYTPTHKYAHTNVHTVTPTYLITPPHTDTYTNTHTHTHTHRHRHTNGKLFNQNEKTTKLSVKKWCTQDMAKYGSKENTKNLSEKTKQDFFLSFQRHPHLFGLRRSYIRPKRKRWQQRQRRRQSGLEIDQAGALGRYSQQKKVLKISIQFGKFMLR